MRLLRAAAFAVLTLLPSAALACPACARDGDSAAVAWLMGAMMLAPIALGGIVFAVVRRMPRDEPHP
jgi:hypothetical protein